MIRAWFRRRRQEREQRLMACLANGERWSVIDLAAAAGFADWNIASVYAFLDPLEAAGIIESDRLDGPYPGLRWYRLADRGIR